VEAVSARNRSRFCLPMDQFTKLKSALVKKNALWEDPDFPANSTVLAADDRNSRYVKWMRPGVSNVTCYWLINYSKQ